ncbi:MAG: type II toxin-antitoxin system Phd/YefM family antitoxin [Eggerthellaceae bacterium]|nr:type II toxin-antitoxin system Phd/YefM family antitoxin [Eggerthellaceae bacterium]
MTSITATAARKDLYNLIARANEDCKPIAITNTKGKGAVLVGEDDWASIEETLYIMGVPGMAQKLIEAHDESVDECISADELEW